MAVIFEIYDSLLAVWFFHMVMNAASVIMSCRLSCRYFAQGAVQAQDFQYIPGILVGGALLLLGLYKIRKDGKNRETIVHSNTVL